MKKEKVVYTCITGGYDAIPCHAYVDDDWDYILFTDNEELIEQAYIYHWEVRRNPFNDLDNVRNARYCKINAHKVCTEYQYSLYLDGNIIVNNNSIFMNTNNLIKQHTIIAIPIHPMRTCIYDEADVVKQYHIDYSQIVDKQIAFLKSEQYPMQNGLFETGIIFRKHHNERLVAAQELWWKMLTRFSKRDQLSQLYAFWKHKVTVHPLFEDRTYHRNCDGLTFMRSKTHNQNKVSFKQKYPNWLINSLCFFIPIKAMRHAMRKKLKSIGEYLQ